MTVLGCNEEGREKGERKRLKRGEMRSGDLEDIMISFSRLFFACSNATPERGRTRTWTAERKKGGKKKVARKEEGIPLLSGYPLSAPEGGRLSRRHKKMEEWKILQNLGSCRSRLVLVRVGAEERGKGRGGRRREIIWRSFPSFSA